VLDLGSGLVLEVVVVAVVVALSGASSAYWNEMLDSVFDMVNDFDLEVAESMIDVSGMAKGSVATFEEVEETVISNGKSYEFGGVCGIGSVCHPHHTFLF